MKEDAFFVTIARKDLPVRGNRPLNHNMSIEEKREMVCPVLLQCTYAVYGE